MNNDSMWFSRMLRTLGMIVLLFAAVSFTSTANAAQGCGYGYHYTYHGCILNHPGAGATPAPYHPGCWRNMWGQLRCYR